MTARPTDNSAPCHACDGVRLHPDERQAIVRDLLAALGATTAELKSAGTPAQSATTLQPHQHAAYNATAKDVAQRLGVTAAWVREHAEDLGGVRVGTGKKPRHRFNVAVADERVAAMRSEAERNAPKPPARLRNRRPRKNTESDVPLLPVKGRVYK